MFNLKNFLIAHSISKSTMSHSCSIRGSRKSLTILIIVLAILAQLTLSCCSDSEGIEPLTNLINSGRIQEARNQASVKFRKIQSYTGFLTVNESYNSNLFFWFIPTIMNEKEDLRRNGRTERRKEDSPPPLILWLQGGPGTSSLFGLFVENGPFTIDSELTLRLRKYSWTKSHSMLYIDSPVGTGFSFTNSELGYSKTEEDVAENLYSALIQFFKLFPEISQLDFYVAGESYAGKYVPMLSMKINKENKDKHGRDFINLKGIAIGAGFCDPINMISGYADYLYFTGLVNKEARNHFAKQAALTQQLILSGNYSGAYQVQDELFGGDFIQHATYFKNHTGFENYHNLLEPNFPEEPDYYDSFVQLNHIRSRIHVGNSVFERQSVKVAKELKNDIFRTVRPIVEQLLNLNYKVLLYVGQFDIVVPHVAVTNFINHLYLPNKKNKEESERKILRNSDDEILGYLQKSENLIYVIVRNAGHHVPFDQPKWMFDIITRFTRGNLQ